MNPTPLHTPPDSSSHADHTMELNLGPSHPAMHGTVRIRLKLDGETILRSETDVGFLHRGFEKESETVHWSQVMPYTDRLNYVSPLINNFAYASAVEKLCDIQIPKRAQYIRVIASEISRICDHMTCLAAVSMELGGFTPFLYMMEGRELLWDLIESLTGARVTVNYGRIGGVAFDLPENFAQSWKTASEKAFSLINDTDNMLTHNQIFIQRVQHIGTLSAQQAMQYGITGPFLRACGVAHDLRKSSPYEAYAELDFDIPVGSVGDCYDRWLVRLEEMRQSRRLVDQALKQIPPGKVLVEDPRFVLPEKKQVYTQIEGLMNHFKLIIEGAQVPNGSIYHAVEGANGELGFFIVSDGGGKAYKCHVRSPCFMIMQTLDPILLPQAMLSDVVPIFGSVNMIGGECDR